MEKVIDIYYEIRPIPSKAKGVVKILPITARKVCSVIVWDESVRIEDIARLGQGDVIREDGKFYLVKNSGLGNDIRRKEVEVKFLPSTKLQELYVVNWSRNCRGFIRNTITEKSKE